MSTYTRISVQEAHKIMGEEKAVIVDVRDISSFSQGHIDQAQNLDNENIGAFLKMTDKELPLICYCYHGFSSQQTAQYFLSHGFKRVYSMDGGWEGWKAVYV